VICIAAAHRSSNIGEDLQSRRACPRLQRWGAEFDELAVTNIVPALIDPLYNDQTSVHLLDNELSVYIVNNHRSAVALTF